MQSLAEARELNLQLVAAQEGVIFPQFGAVSLENAGRQVPLGLTETLVSTADAESIRTAVGQLLTLLDPFIAEHALQELAGALDRHLCP